MPVRFQITVTNNTTGATQSAPGEIPDDDWAKLLAFRAEWVRLQQAEWIAAGMSAAYGISIQAGSGLVVTTPNRPSDAGVREVLHGLRPFILQNEPHFVLRTVGIFARALPSAAMRGHIRRISDAFTGATQSSMFQLSANTLQLNSDHALSLWLNAFEYHRDPDQYAELVRACGGEPGELELAVFRAMLCDKVRAIAAIGNLTTLIEAGPGTVQDAVT